MKNSTYIKLAGLIGLIGCSMTATSLAESLLHAGSVSYSPDRWPARWSTIVQQNQAIENGNAYGYGNYQTRPVRHENPWAHDSSVLFKVPAGHRPWGAPPRKTRRQVRADRYRDQRRPMYRPSPMYNQYGYGGMMPQSYPGLGYMRPFGSLGSSGLANPYGISPMLRSPLLASPYMGYPAATYPVGMGGMNWPFGAW